MRAADVLAVAAGLETVAIAGGRSRGRVLAIGLLYTYLHADRYRVSLFFQPPAGVTSMSVLRGLEAVGASNLLTFSTCSSSPWLSLWLLPLPGRR
ncbi:MAG: hypothetical protein R3C44_19990 [Chloroflexota bacterium]